MKAIPRSWKSVALLTPVLALAGSPSGPDDAASRIVGAALTDSRAYAKLAWLTDRIGHRLSGSEALNRAIAWSVQELERDGIDRVWTEEVTVPHWVREAEAARIVHPIERDMATLALGGSVPTPEGGLTAELVVVTSFEELDALGDAVRGKIVLFNKPIERNGKSEQGYGSVSGLRVDGPSRAARQGAVATLIRSLGTADYRLPHTGMLYYREDAPRIPAAAIAAEDAALLQRLVEAGESVRVRLELRCRNLPDAISANVIADLRGRERPEEIVLIGAHLDSWDVGSGAHDDGAGVAIVMETMRLLEAHDLVPRRTIRAVLFTNEENGLQGGRAYALRHRDEMSNHVVAIESDAGGGTPLGFAISGGEGAVEVVTDIARRLAVIGAADVTLDGGGADISRMREYLVPQMSLRQDTTRYFDYHHTEADTLDKVDKADLDRNVAALALMAYLLAERDVPLPRPSFEQFIGVIEPVSLETRDGATRPGSLGLPAGATGKSPAVILIDEAGSDRHAWDGFVRKLLSQGFAVLAHDVRGSPKGRRDLAAAVALLQSHEAIDAERIGVVGSSAGASLAVEARSEMEIRTVVALSGEPSAILDPSRREDPNLRSIFHIAAEGDQDGKRAGWARRLHDRTAAPRRLEIVEGSSSRGAKLLADAPALADRIVDWLKRTL